MDVYGLSVRLNRLSSISPGSETYKLSVMPDVAAPSRTIPAGSCGADIAHVGEKAL